LPHMAFALQKLQNGGWESLRLYPLCPRFYNTSRYARLRTSPTSILHFSPEAFRLTGE